MIVGTTRHVRIIPLAPPRSGNRWRPLNPPKESSGVPTYEYECTACTHRFEVMQRFSDDPLTQCPECRGRVRKVFHPVGIIFKGDGWYATDSRASSEKNKFKDDGKAPAESGDAGEDKADKPAKDGATTDAPAKETAAAKSEAKAEPAKGAASD